MHKRHKTAILGAVFALFASGAAAQQQQMIRFSSGTGFFVTSSGDIITNHHVVDGCKEVTIQGGVPENKAKVIAVDKKFDLALLRTTVKPWRIASLRHPDLSGLKLNEPVMVMGYPLDSYKNKKYKIAVSKVMGLKGPLDEPEWIQFADAALQGNSGGPLLDGSGNVAGVVVGKSQLFRKLGNGREEIVSKSDLAISVDVLMTFLDHNYVNYRFTSSQGYMMPQRIEEEAKNYIVNVLCQQPD